MFRLIGLFLFSFILQNNDIMAQQITGHWQGSDGVQIILTEEGITKITNTNGIFYGKWEIENDQIILNLFSELEPYVYNISGFFENLSYTGEGYIPEGELAIYRNGYQLEPLLEEESQEASGTVSLDTKWLVSPSPLKGSHVGTWKMEDGTLLDLSEWGAFRVASINNEISYGLFELEDGLLRLQFLFHDGIHEYDVGSIANQELIGASTLTSAEFQQAELQMFNQLLSQVQSTNQMMNQMSSQMLEQMHQTTQKMIINLSGNDWIYEDERY